MRQKIVAGNWKMNTTYDEGLQLANAIVKASIYDKKVILIPPFTHLKGVSNIINNKTIFLGAQNCHWEEYGAYTGEISAKMLRSIGVYYVLIGHSERRIHFKETSELLLRKIRTALANELKVIFCCGEPESVRNELKHNEYVKKQLEETIFHLPAQEVKNIIIAYEPIWAIGTGKTATPKQAEEIHAFIRHALSDKFDMTTAESTSILYGGSCKPENAKELFSQPNIDGGLIGGASLKAQEFLSIIDQL